MSKHWRFAAKLSVNHGRFMMCKAQWICWMFLTGLTATAAATVFRSCLCLLNVLLGAFAIFVCSTYIVILHFSALTDKRCIDDRPQCPCYSLHISLFSKAIELHKLNVNHGNSNASLRHMMPPGAAIEATELCLGWRVAWLAGTSDVL